MLVSGRSQLLSYLFQLFAFESLSHKLYGTIWFDLGVSGAQSSAVAGESLEKFVEENLCGDFHVLYLFEVLFLYDFYRGKSH